ncbi:LysR family transcriptional regulator [Luteibacter sp. dw_328]|uniref:LysR family transcriptional regulator n=1 Tax=Luteibacter sp. dw_328 TaxID=2719796 RepID=UPI001BD4E0CF|nr:LysR family transcriptional regulator [Luteibacter sp. dw_328]
MDTLNGIVCFIRSAESGSFAAAGRALGLTPAAVGKNVARLEASLGVRLFQRSTRRLSLTEAGEAFRLEVVDSLDSLQTAMSNATVAHASPVGRLRVSMGNAFGRDWIVPMLGSFLRANPRVQPDWHFDNRAVDLIGEGFDVAIGGGFELQPGLIARHLAPAHRVLVASPAYLSTRGAPATPADLVGRAGILLRSPQTGRIRNWTLTDGAAGKASIDLDTRILFDDPDAANHAAMQGLGIALVAVPHALPYIERGVLRRVLPDWWVDGGDISIYYAAQKLLPRKTRVFVEHVMASFERDQLAARFSAQHADMR